MEAKTNTNQHDLIPKENGPVTRKSRKKTIVAVFLGIAAIIAGSAGFYYFSSAGNYFATDNAKVTAKMYTVTPFASGKLLEWNAKEGERVEKDQILGRQEVLPYITSPVTGTIIKNNVNEGQTVSPASQLAVIADTDNLYIGVNIEETDIMKVGVGQVVEVKIDAYAGRTFSGVVDEIDRATQTYFSGAASFNTSGTYTKVTQHIPVKVLIDNDEKLPLTFGMNANVKIHLNEKKTDYIPQALRAAQTADKHGASYTGYVEAADQVGVSPNISAKVSKINVKVGQRVERGEVLFTLDDSDYILQVKQAAAGIIPAQAAYDEAAAHYERQAELLAAGAISQVELDGVKARMDTALAQLESAQTLLAIAQKKVNDCTVRAPIAGEVSARNITAGSMVSPQAAAVTIINAQNVLVHIQVTETHIAKIESGSEAEIGIQAIGLTRTGKVTGITPVSDPKTATFTVEITINNSDGKIRPGMIADVKL